ncbi:hypothetical protein E1285_06625 [Actinomadura sp. 7K507]|nr:hypothetical protein E1285_06625 [Actinomadura sp. 7K507]
MGRAAAAVAPRGDGAGQQLRGRDGEVRDGRAGTGGGRADVQRGRLDELGAVLAHEALADRLRGGRDGGHRRDGDRPGGGQPVGGAFGAVRGGGHGRGPDGGEAGRDETGGEQAGGGEPSGDMAMAHGMSLRFFDLADSLIWGVPVSR